ncbi:Flp pilus assembly CpaF family ATPase [Mesorhizobium sangaii]|uniref:Flp pilus assembly CpaF family ATPase n=1 Tax=Mesorhizobium sangaii TaxID=505389 RepID=A0A841PYH3_9HYPH|nr:Flp pilus assembly CpaF family ATPase [Mesorhizobium sangaii]
MGSTICNTVDDALVVEIMLNPDGQLFIEQIGEPITQAGKLASQAAGDHHWHGRMHWERK